MSNVIKLSPKASKRFRKILKQPLTETQKKSIEQSKGVYAYYKARFSRRAKQV